MGPDRTYPRESTRLGAYPSEASTPTTGHEHAHSAAPYPTRSYIAGAIDEPAPSS
jgi:hypothetical protein